jgi:hypothetical protein
MQEPLTKHGHTIPVNNCEELGTAIHIPQTRNWGEAEQPVKLQQLKKY